MAWDTERTRARLRAAGTRQFAAHGFAGARMDAIGRDSGVNKERVYRYFGNKRGLFDAVLMDRLGALLHATTPVEPGPAGIGRFAGELFDHVGRHPEIARLLAWESLELQEPVTAADRGDRCAEKVAQIDAAIGGVGSERAAHVLLSVVTLVLGTWTLARVADVITPGADLGERRAHVVAQARALGAA